MMREAIGAVLAIWLWAGGVATAAEGEMLRPAPGVRGYVVRAPGKVAVDGRLDEWSKAFCTPVAYNHKDPANRAAQFFYLWDDEALYIGLRALDQKQSDHGGLRDLYNGDAVEFYLDTRTGDALRSKEWSPGAVHLYFTAFDKDRIGPRWSIRKGIASSDVALKGVEIAATADATGYDLEFKLPWANFPGFAPKTGAVLALDAELCYADGPGRSGEVPRRVDRTFAFGSPLSVQQPASQAKVQLIESFERVHMTRPVAASMFPMWVETPWVQPERAQVRAVVAIPPSFADEVETVAIRVHDLGDMMSPKGLPATIESFGPEGRKFVRAVATWSIDDFAPGTFVVTGVVTTRADRHSGGMLEKQDRTVTVAPRLVQEAIISGR